MNSATVRLKEQFSILQQAINLNKALYDEWQTEEKSQSCAYIKLKTEYQELKTKISELEAKKCEMCETLKQKLAEERKLTKSANSRLKLIASLLCSDDGDNTNALTNVKWTKLTQILEDPSDKVQSKKRKFNSLIADDEEHHSVSSAIIVPETMPLHESQLGLQDKCLVIPETQINTECLQDNKSVSNLICDFIPQNNTFLEKVEEKVEKLRAQRQSHSSKDQIAWTKSNDYRNYATSSSKKDENEGSNENCSRMLNHKKIDTLKAEKLSSPSVISTKLNDNTKQTSSDVDVSLNASNSKKSFNLRNANEKKSADSIQDSYWKLKPSKLIKSDNLIKGEKASKSNLKQTTLSLGVVKKKQDISTLKNFNGGATNSYNEENDDDNDVVPESPQQTKNKLIKHSSRKSAKEIKLIVLEEAVIQESDACVPEHETRLNRADMAMKLETNDLDETLFVPAATSTCLPTLPPDDSFDRLPAKPKSPNYKYKREAVRKKQERLRLPGWSCDECEQYYKVAGQTWSREEIQKRMNACSKHRDKYMLRPKTPPGFWNPVIPPS